jgi:hypothetical protein
MNHVLPYVIDIIDIYIDVIDIGDKCDNLKLTKCFWLKLNYKKIWVYTINLFNAYICVIIF